MKINNLIYAVVSFIALGATTVNLSAEKKNDPSIKFEETVFDFGTIKEEGGPVSHEFKFVNTGDGNLVIQSARAECGCTKPQYPEKPVASGKSGVIKVTYNPAGRPGGFTKVVTVRCNGNPSKVNLKIRGTVVPNAKTLSSRYPVKKGDMLMETDVVKIGEIEAGQNRYSFISIYNSGMDTLTPALMSSEKGLMVSVKPEKLAPGEMGTISLFLNTSRLRKTGLQQMQVNGKWNDNPGNGVSIQYAAIIKPKNKGGNNVGNFN